MFLQRIKSTVRFLQDIYTEPVTVHRVNVHLDEVCEGVVDVGSFRQEKATAWTHVIKEEQLLVLRKNVYTWHL